MGTKIYVGNMSYRSTEDTLRSLFSQFGETKSVSIITDRETGQAKGFAFVEMGTDAEADAAIQALNGQVFEGRTLRVNEAIQKPRREY
ncbi:MAG: RNA-binding protein [Spirochaetes bacterium GWB1_48_6]|nr:MAG: RNA-binding protein [Spirochaetes bacterium GWB1_48_6]